MISYKHILFFSILGFFSLSAFSQSDQINAIVGNQSWLEHFGDEPDSSSSEALRITTHLKYVIELLKNTQQQSDFSEQRMQNIAHLEDYVAAQQFPKHNMAFPDRQPRFIDHNGSLCAVGYLVAVTAGRQEAERINQSYEYAFVTDINDEGLLAWQKRSGFTMLELAMIQPEYEPRIVPLEPKEQIGFYNEGGRFGLINNYTHEKITKAKYTNILVAVANHLFLTEKDGYWGVTDKTGKDVIRHRYYIITPMTFDEQIILLARVNERLEIYNQKAQEIASLDSGNVWQITHSFLEVNEGKGHGVIDAEGKWRLQPVFKEIVIEVLVHFNVDDGAERTPENKCLFITTNQQDKVGVFNSRGEKVIPQEYESITRNLFVFAAEKDGKMELYKLNGEKMNLSGVEALKPISDDRGETTLLGQKKGKWGLITQQGEWGIPPRYKYMTRQQKFYIAKTDSTISYYDYFYKPFMPIDQKYIHRYGDLIHYGTDSENAVIRIDGSFLIEPTSDSLNFLDYNSGNIVFSRKTNDKWFLVYENGYVQELEGVSKLSTVTSDAIRFTKGPHQYFGVFKNGQLIKLWSRPFDNLRHLHKSVYAIKYQEKFGFLMLLPEQSPQVRVIYPIELDSVSHVEFENNNVFLVQKAGLWGLLGLYGNMIIPCAYTDYREKYDDRMFLIGVYLKKQKTWYYFAQEGQIIEAVNNKLQQLLEKSNATQMIDSESMQLRSKQN